MPARKFLIKVKGAGRDEVRLQIKQTFAVETNNQLFTQNPLCRFLNLCPQFWRIQGFCPTCE